MIAEAFLIGALALPGLSGRHKNLSQSDRDFLGMLVDFAGSHPYSVVIHDRKSDLQADMELVSPGGFLLIRQRYKKKQFLVDHGWQMFPAYWNRFQIFRKSA